MNTTTSPIYINTTKDLIFDANTIALGGSLLGIDVCIIIFNILTIMVIVRFRTKNAVDIFVLTLALHDLVKGLVPVPITVYVYFSDWRIDEGSVVCNLYGWVAFMTNAGSMLTLTLMAVERFGAILKPFTYRAWVSPEKVQVIAFSAVVFTAFHSALPLMGVGRIITYYNGAYSHFDYSRDTKGTIIYSQFILCYGFGMILVVIIAYSFVFYKIRTLIHRHRRMSRVSGHYNTNAGRELNLKTETMFSYLALALMLLFSFSWLPFLSVVVASQMDVKMHLANLDLFAMRVVVVNSMLNPLAYAALCKPYRRGIIYYFRKGFSIFGFQRPSDDIWDPWRRASMARRRQTDRYTSHSCTDSGIGGVADYNRRPIPSTFQSYDTYRAKKEDRRVRIADELSSVKENGSNCLSSDESTQFDDSATKALLDKSFGIATAHAYDDVIPNGDNNQGENEVANGLTTSQDKVPFKEAINGQLTSPQSFRSVGVAKKNKYVVLSERGPSKSRTQSVSNIPSGKDEMKEKYTKRRSTASLDCPLDDKNVSIPRVTFAKDVKQDDLIDVPKKKSSNALSNGQIEMMEASHMQSPDECDSRMQQNHNEKKQQQQQQQPEQPQSNQQVKNNQDEPPHRKQKLSLPSKYNVMKNESAFRPKSKSTTSLINDKNNEQKGRYFEKKSSASLDFYLQDSLQYGHTRKQPKTENNDKCITRRIDITANGDKSDVTNPQNSKHTSDNGCINMRTTVLKDLVHKVSEFDSDDNETVFCCRSNNRYFLRTCESQQNCECNDLDGNEGSCDRCVKKCWSHQDLVKNNREDVERTQSLQTISTCACVSQRCVDECIEQSTPFKTSFLSKRPGSDLVIPLDNMRSECSTPHSNTSSLILEDDEKEFTESDRPSEAIVFSMYENPIYDT